MPDGAVIIAAIPLATIPLTHVTWWRVGILAKKANELGLTRKPGWNHTSPLAQKWLNYTCKTLASCPNWKNSALVSWHLPVPLVTVCRCVQIQRFSRIHRPRPVIHCSAIRATATLMDVFIPYAKQASGKPPLVITYAIAGTIRFDIKKTY